MDGYMPLCTVHIPVQEHASIWMDFELNVEINVDVASYRNFQPGSQP